MTGGGTSWGHALMDSDAICRAAQAHEPCAVCGATPGHPCEDDRPGTHLCRVCVAAKEGHVTYGDAASLMHDMDVFTGASLILTGVTP